jgi:hypothetical protein
MHIVSLQAIASLEMPSHTGLPDQTLTYQTPTDQNTPGIVLNKDSSYDIVCVVVFTWIGIIFVARAVVWACSFTLVNESAFKHGSLIQLTNRNLRQACEQVLKCRKKHEHRFMNINKLPSIVN